MFRAALVLVAWLATAPVAAQQPIACVDNDQQMLDAAREAGEALQWSGVSALNQPFWFFASFQRQTYTVWFRLPDGRICTGPGYVGAIFESGVSV